MAEHRANSPSPAKVTLTTSSRLRDVVFAAQLELPSGCSVRPIGTVGYANRGARSRTRVLLRSGFALIRHLQSKLPTRGQSERGGADHLGGVATSPLNVPRTAVNTPRSFASNNRFCPLPVVVTTPVAPAKLPVPPVTLLS